jgi:hypothetical protein
MKYRRITNQRPSDDITGHNKKGQLQIEEPFRLCKVENRPFLRVVSTEVNCVSLLVALFIIKGLRERVE